MLSRWLESAVEHTNPSVLCSVFASVLAPSLVLLYTGTYNIWFHLVFVSVTAGCFAGLLLHAAGLHARLARLEREQGLKRRGVLDEVKSRSRALDRMKRGAFRGIGRAPQAPGRL